MQCLSALLPEKLTLAQIKCQVLSYDVSIALSNLHCLAHKEHAATAELQRVAKEAGGQISSEVMTGFYRPMGRLNSVTHFKKLVHAAHQDISAKVLDEQVGTQAADLAKFLKTVQNKMPTVTHACAAGENGAYSHVMEFINMAVDMRMNAATLPQATSSQHWPSIQKVMDAFDQDRRLARQLLPPSILLQSFVV